MAQFSASWGGDASAGLALRRSRRKYWQMKIKSLALIASAVLICSVPAYAQLASGANPAALAFEEARWTDVITENRRILIGNPDDPIALLRIAQAQRELGRYDDALATLSDARNIDPQRAIVDLERARNHLLSGNRDDAMIAMLDADHNGLRARAVLEEHSDFDSIRDTPQFHEVLRNVRARVFPCQLVGGFSQFDFWVGEWEVRTSDGSLAGHNTITKEQGGCELSEHWVSASGSAGRSTSFYIPSSDLWRQVWVGSNGTLIDMSGSLIDGEMRMEGTIEYTTTGRVVAFRATWSTNAENSIVRQRMEEFDVATAAWQLWFDGFYRRIDDS